ncbi:hypothetical protein ACP4OV_009361 [Aristida adscensionis]
MNNHDHPALSLAAVAPAPAPAPAAAAAAAAPAAGAHAWALLDPTILEGSAAADSTRHAACSASTGGAVRVSLLLAEPPSCSYVQLHIDAEVQVYVEPTLGAVDGGLLLLHMGVTAVRDPPLISYEDNFFVYKAHPEPGMAWLRLLPHFDALFAPVRIRRVERAGPGVDEDDAEDDLLDEVGKLSRYSSSTEQWETLDLPMPYDPDKGLYRLVWATDDMFAHDGLMFWVDYHRGMIYCDVFLESPSLQFIEFPGIHVWGPDEDYTRGRRAPQAYRTVGFSKGQLRFVDIDNGVFGTRKTSGFTITMWSLSMSEMVWIKDSLLRIDDLWLQPSFRDSPLPRWVPEYPVMSKQDSNILHVILRGPRYDGKAWVATLDMREGVDALKSCRPFINAYKSEFEGCGVESVDTTNMFFDTPFLYCDFNSLDKSTGD